MLPFHSLQPGLNCSRGVPKKQASLQPYRWQSMCKTEGLGPLDSSKGRTLGLSEPGISLEPSREKTIDPECGGTKL